jgi:hypothetical protein
MSKEAMTKAIEVLKKCHYYMIDAGLPNQSMLIDVFKAYKALEAALAEQPAQQEHHDPIGDAQYKLIAEQAAQQEPVSIEHCLWAQNGNTPCPHTSTPAQRKPLTDEERKKLRDAFAQSLTSVYVCGRVWEAWQYGTMTEDDFQPASECEEVLDSLIEAAHGIKENT